MLDDCAALVGVLGSDDNVRTMLVKLPREDSALDRSKLGGASLGTALKYSKRLVRRNGSGFVLKSSWNCFTAIIHVESSFPSAFFILIKPTTIRAF